MAIRGLDSWSSCRPAAGAIAVAMALGAACTQPVNGLSAAPPPGEWRSFEGTWSATGDRRTLDAAPDRPASVVDMAGSLLLTGERGLGVGFLARAIAYSDGTERGAGRAVWTDERGDRIFSELRGAPVATGRNVHGTFTGGTGRWTGITGEYDLDWKYVVEAADGRVQGRAVDLRGRARIVAPEGGAR